MEFDRPNERKWGMVTAALFVRLVAKSRKDAAVERFLKAGFS
jgi:hypothetical protein